MKEYPGEYTITEVEPAPGFQMKEPITQKVILHGGESKTLTFFNEPLNAIVVEKYDSVTHPRLYLPAAFPGRHQRHRRHRYRPENHREKRHLHLDRADCGNVYRGRN